MADIASEAGLRAVDPFVPSISKLCVYLWDEAWRAAPQVLASDDEALHDMRVALRRLRSTLENSAILSGDFVREDIARELTFERRALRKIGDALGAVRDYDVLLQYLEEYRTTQTGEASGKSSEEEEQPDGLEKFSKYLHKCREERFEPMTRAITRADRAGKAREKFARWAHGLAGVREPDVPLINAAREVLHLRVDEAIAMGHVLQSHDEEEQHNLRKSLRRLRYTLEAFGPAFEKPKPQIKKLTAMQDVLGEMQDRSVLRTMLCAAYKVDSVKDLPEGARQFGEFGDARREELLTQMRATWAEHEQSGFWDAMRRA